MLERYSTLKTASDGNPILPTGKSFWWLSTLPDSVTCMLSTEPKGTQAILLNLNMSEHYAEVGPKSTRGHGSSCTCSGRTPTSKPSYPAPCPKETLHFCGIFSPKSPLKQICCTLLDSACMWKLPRPPWAKMLLLMPPSGFAKDTFSCLQLCHRVAVGRCFAQGRWRQQQFVYTETIWFSCVL